MIALWLDDILLDHGNYAVHDVPAAQAEQTEPDDQLNDKLQGIALLSAHLFCRIGGATTRASECRSINLMSTSAAGYERHDANLIPMTAEL